MPSQERMPLPQASLETVHSITEGLRARYDTAVLTPGKVKEIPARFDSKQEMAVCGNAYEGVDQHLRAFVKAGDEFFAIVDVVSIVRPDGKRPIVTENTVITRHKPNNRAEFVDFVDKDQTPITIGRSYQPGLSAKTSREHFSVVQARDGSIGIVEPKETTNGTEVFTPSQNSKFGISEKLLHMDTVDAAEDNDFWSLKSKSIQQLMELAN